jgi:biopolymer transport protein ExbB
MKLNEEGQGKIVRSDKRSYFSTECLSRRLLGAIVGVAFLLGGPILPEANAWWDGNWKLRKTIQFDTSSKAVDIKATLTDAPVLVRLHTGNFNFSSAKADGSDLRFVSADDKLPLKYHIEKFDSKEEIALVWVKVPSISGGSNQNSIWMYYGNPSAQDGQDAGGTYDVSQVAVYHLGEPEGLPKDATAYANHAASFSGKLNLPSLIGNGAQFGGGGEKMTIAKSPSLNFEKGFTFSTWLRLSRPAKDARVFSWDDGKQSVVIGMDETKVYCSLSSGKGQTVVTPKTAALTPNRWSHLAVAVDPNNRIALYLDGIEMVSSKLKGPVPQPSADMIIGAPAKGGNAFAGDLDEVQLSNTVRPAEWMRAAFQGQGPDGALTSVSLEEETGGGKGETLTIHLIKVIIRTITLDGWLIIGFLAIMGGACFIVFADKIMTIRKARNGNEKFSKDFRLVDRPLSLLEKGQDFQDSSLYRVYSAGCDELKIWLEKKGGSLKEGRGLSDRALSGFKAALERASMHESRKFSAGMFILSLGVAGGPFMGLLGTVWGVMNCFAGLAEASEANLQAIAPGVASALACTLSGLLVAIPALFGSIYITGLIKNLNADMNVFVDDFILRMEDERGNVQ